MKRGVVLGLALSTALACGGGSLPKGAEVPLASLRSDGKDSRDPELVARWLLAERLAPGGDAKRAADAEKRLKEVGGTGLYASFARALSAEEHGAPNDAADAFVATLVAAQRSEAPDTALVAWFTTNQLRGLRQSVTGLYKKHRGTLEKLIAAPGRLGWRAVAELQDWSATETYRAAEKTGKDYDAFVVSQSGCLSGLRLAGPFGRGTPPDHRRHFAAEEPRPWPLRWPADPSRGIFPKVLKTEQDACAVTTAEQTAAGVFYVEGFFTSDHERDLIVTAQSASEIWVDDAPVLNRDLRDWGVWQKFGAAIHVAPGRHRIVARLIDDQTVVRVLEPDGRPATVTADTKRDAPWAMVPPRVLDDPNPLAAIVAAEGTRSPLDAYLTSYLAHLEGLDDVANVILEPFVEPEDAAPFMLESAGSFANSDPIYPQEARHRRSRELLSRAAAKDDRLWFSRAWLALDDAEQKGAVDAVDPLRKLADDFATQPELREELAKLYGRLGWRAERLLTLQDLATRFPENARVLRALMNALGEDGSVQESDRIATRLKELEPDAEIELDMALARHDWKAAVGELERLQKRRPDRKELASRIADVLLRSGDPSKAAEQLTKALEKNPQDAVSRFRMADRTYAKGDMTALRQALAEALRVGSSGAELRAAIDLLEGTMDLEPYRQDGRAVIGEFEAWEKKGKKMPGVSARVLDYAALWVHPDGSSEMLEHEILKIQSQGAIGEESEQEPPSGMVLRLRVIKANGKILEPEPVSGKPTLTMPNLEVGDYLEIEHVTKTEGDGERGRRYHGPTWFFREKDKGYWRSEFVVLTPKDKPLDVEARGTVGAPKTSERGPYVERSWRVDESPPLPEEPDAPSPAEFLPSVRVGWGIALDDTLARFVDLVSEETPVDPRLRREALLAVQGIPAADPEARARKLYRAVLDRVQDGQEKDGRRAWLGKSGSRQAAFQYMVRALGLKLDMVLAKSRIAIPPVGKMSEIDNYSSMLLRLDMGAKGSRYLTVSDKFAPFGYVPAEVRGQEAVVLVDGAPRVTVPADGTGDGVVFEGRADLHDDGGAAVELVQRFNGKLGIRMRNVFDKVQDSQLYAFVESRLLTATFPGARVRDVKIENKTDLDQPLILRIKADVPQLGKAQGDKLAVRPPASMHIAQLASLNERQTPLLLGASSHVEVRFDIVAPASWHMPASLPTGEVRDGDRVVKVADVVRGHEIHFDRVIDLPAGRVQPGKEYSAFLKFTEDADTLLERDILLGK